jgi:hypothetical protein
MAQGNDDHARGFRPPDPELALGAPSHAERYEQVRDVENLAEHRVSPIREPVPSTEPPRSTAKIWAGVSVMVMLVVAAAVVTATLVVRSHRTPPSAPATSAAAQGRTSFPSTTAAHLPAAHLPAAHLPAASANVLTPFVREWSGMRESVVIDASGHGRFHYMMLCASCSMADMPYNTMDFTLTSVSNGVASGSVTASSDPRFPLGEPVVITLAPQDTIKWTAGGKNEGLFCGSNPAWCGG